MSDEYTMNVKVNGLEDVERLRKAIEAIESVFGPVHTHHPGAGSRRYDVRVDFGDGGVLTREMLEDADDGTLGQEPNAPKFDPGDVVCLKSGGPEMTITGVVDDRAAVAWIPRTDTDGSWDAVPQYEATAAREEFPFACLERTR